MFNSYVRVLVIIITMIMFSGEESRGADGYAMVKSGQLVKSCVDGQSSAIVGLGLYRDTLFICGPASILNEICDFVRLVFFIMGDDGGKGDAQMVRYDNGLLHLHRNVCILTPVQF